MISKTQVLSNGREMPTIGLGTWGLTDEAVLESSIRSAISLGYRHIDTAFIYGNEKKIGRILNSLFEEGVVERKDLFVTSKLWNTFHKAPRDALAQTLADLRMEYVDLYLVHWPVVFEPAQDGEMSFGGERYNIGKFDPVGVWKKMEELVDLGMAKSIGISNFGIENTKHVLRSCRIRPAVAQFELHPYLPQKDLVELMRSERIQVVSYSSLGSATGPSPRVREDETIKKIASKHRCSPSQVILSYIAMQGICVIPRSTSRKHLQENIDLKELDKEDFSAIDNLGIERRYVDPVSFGPSRFK